MTSTKRTGQAEAGPPPVIESEIAYSRGTHRLISPEETIARVQPMLEPLGITRVANVTGLDRIGMPVVMVCRPNSRSLAVSQGKGFELASAKASGLMESVEGWHAENVQLPLRLASYQELTREALAVDVYRLEFTPGSIFEPSLRLLWVEAMDLVRNEPVYVPYESVHLDCVQAFRMGGSFAITSNGLASGNDIGEAVTHGLCELVERMSTAAWAVMPDETRAATRVDLETIDDADCRVLLDLYERAGIEVLVWDATADSGLASFVCVIWSRDDTVSEYRGNSGGMGCHPSRGVALSRALTEAAQSRLTAIAGSRDDMPLSFYRGRGSDLPPIVDGARGRTTKPFQDVPTFEGKSLRQDLEWTLSRVIESGADRIAVVDLSRPEYGIPVVRVIVPGLHGIDQQRSAIRDVAGRPTGSVA